MEDSGSESSDHSMEGYRTLWLSLLDRDGSSRNTDDTNGPESSGPKRKLNEEEMGETDSAPEVKKIKTIERDELYLLNLPSEILDLVLGYLKYSQIARLRQVCLQLNHVCGNILNRTFKDVQSKMQLRHHRIKAQMPRRESARRKHPLARESDIIETLHMRLTLLQMTFGKHIDRGHCCFFPGEILEEINSILRYVETTPNLGRAYKVTDELFDLSTMAMEYFKEHIEPNLPEINYFTEMPDFSFTTSLSTTPVMPRSLLQATSPSREHSPPPPKMSFLNNDSLESAQSSPDFSMSLQQMGREDALTETPSPALSSNRQNWRRYNTDLALVKRELRATKSKLAYQQKQFLECNSKLEQHERKFEEQNKKIEALIKEVQQCRMELQWHRNSGKNSPAEAQFQKTSTDNAPGLFSVSNRKIVKPRKGKVSRHLTRPRQKPQMAAETCVRPSDKSSQETGSEAATNK